MTVIWDDDLDDTCGHYFAVLVLSVTMAGWRGVGMLTVFAIIQVLRLFLKVMESDCY